MPHLESNVQLKDQPGMKEFLHQFESAEAELLVVLGSHIGRAAALAGSDLWIRSQRFVARRELPHGDFVQSDGAFVWCVPQGDCATFVEQVEPYDVFLLTVRKDKKSPDRFALMGVEPFDGLSQASRSEAEALSKKFAQPVTIDTRYGVLELNREFNDFEGSMAWRGAEVLICLGTDEEEPIFATSAGLDSLLRSQIGVLDQMCVDPDIFHHEFTAFAAGELADLATDWQEDPDDSEITEDDFASRIDLRSVTIPEPGSGRNIILEFDDGDMFGGHAIMVEMSYNGAPVKAGME